MITARTDHPYVADPAMYIFDPLIKSLKVQSFREFELIVVDHLIDSRPDALKGQYGFPVKHIRPKHSIWNELRYPALSSAFNTGIMNAEGELIAVIGDCCEFGPEYIYTCWHHYLRGELVNAKVNFTYKRHDPRGLGRIQGFQAWGYQCYSKDALRDTNGFDELFDGAKGHEDTELGIRIGRAGYRTVIPIDHTAIEYEHIDVYDPNKKPCVPGTPYIDQSCNYLNGRQAKDNDAYLKVAESINRIKANDGNFPGTHIQIVKRRSEGTGKITEDFKIYETQQPNFAILPPPEKPKPPIVKPKVMFITGTFCARALKEYMQLTDAGYDVTVLYSDPNPKHLAYVKKKMVGVLNFAGIQKAVNAVNPQIVHVHNPPSEPVHHLKKFFKGIVVLDIHDLVTVADVKNDTPERRDLKEADYVYTVSPHYAQYIKEKMVLNRPIYSVESIYWISNFRKLGKLSSDGSTHLCFIGSMYSEITARVWCGRMKRFAEERKIHFHVHVNYFKRVVSEYASKYFHVEPEIDFMDIPSALSRYDAGFIPDAGIPDTMPNKMFDYLNAGIPCIVEPGRGRLCDVVLKYNVGIKKKLSKIKPPEIELLKKLDVSKFPNDFNCNLVISVPPYGR